MGGGFPKTPAAVAGWSGTAIAVASQGLNGGGEPCAVLNTGSVKCWDAQSNNGSLTTIAGITTAVKIAIGGSQGTYCVITTTGALRCWGDNTFGAIGDGSNGSRVSTAAFTVFASGVTDVAVGEISTCAVVNGGAQCWGANASGEIGSGSATGTKSPTAVLNMTSGVTKISLTVTHTCAIQNGNAFCWGDGTSGDLGNGGTSQQNAPVAVINAPGVLTSISTGQSTSVGFCSCKMVRA
jgi:alpha-tubulin suppressor-like RCC1 family protein